MNIHRVSGTIAGFVEDVTEIGRLSKPQRKHLAEYLMGMMVPPETRRKSVKSINGIVGGCNQSSLNRFLNKLDAQAFQDSWVLYLQKEIGGRPVYFVPDDSLLKHEYAVKMEGVASFFDHCKNMFVYAHQLVTSILVTEDGEVFPFLCKPYENIESFLGNCRCKKCKQVSHRFAQLGITPCKCKDCRVENFKTKNRIAKEMFDIARKKFNVIGSSFDSWYLSEEMTTGNSFYVSELKSNRWINPSNVPVKFADLHSGKYRKNVIRKAGWRKTEEYAEKLWEKGLFTERKDAISALKKFTWRYQTSIYLHSGEHVSLLILCDPIKHEFKYLVSNKLDVKSEGMLHLWRLRWSIEEFHKDAKSLGLGEYQLRKLHSVLIHGQITFMAYSLLRSFVSKGKGLFDQCVNTIGECSRMLKRVLLSTAGQILHLNTFP